MIRCLREGRPAALARVVTVIVAIGGLVFALNGQLRDDLWEVRDEVRALRDDVQDLGERVTRLEVRIEAGGEHQAGADGD